ncbi:MAG: glycosyltransferase [Lachnospiraceae bacterium]|nr:glycosyltransferase [Lachnospiraceae bacterium]
MDKKRIIYVIGGYDALDHNLREMVKYYDDKGYDLYEFNIKDPIKSLGGLYEFLEKGSVTAALFSNQVGMFTEIKQGVNLWDALNVPCIDIMMDHPFTYAPILTRLPQNSICICQDRNHMAYLQRFYPEIPSVGFLPHGGTLPDKPVMPIHDRPIDVLYTGGIAAPVIDRVMPDFSLYYFPMEKCGKEALDILISEPWHTTEEVIEHALLSHGAEWPDNELREIIADMRYVDLLATSYYREKTIRTLLDGGIKVTLFGSGWDKMDISSHPNVDFGGMIPAKAATEKGLDAKIVLSTMTWFKDGTHDRIFNGMLSGALSVTDTSVYMKEEFTSGDELVMFELTETDQLADTVRDLLSDTDRMQTIADSGRKRAEVELTWQHRAAEIDEAILSV